MPGAFEELIECSVHFISPLEDPPVEKRGPLGGVMSMEQGLRVYEPDHSIKKGIGALYARRGLTFRPFMIGGHQERNRRAGTENTAGIVGMGKAAELAFQTMGQDEQRVGALRDELERSLLELVPDSRVNGRQEKRLPNTLNVSFKYLEGEAILVLLDQHGICASTGSACTARQKLAR